MKRSESNPKPQLSGLYITPETRKTILREVGKTHFRLTDSKVDFNTTNKLAYQKQAGVSSFPNYVIDRHSHWKLGDTSFSSETESLWRFGRIPGSETTAKMLQNKAVERPSKKAGFVLGTGETMDVQSTMKDSYLKHELEEKDETLIKRLKEEMDMHSFALGEDKSEFMTVSRSQYTPKASLSVDLGKIREQLRIRNHNANRHNRKVDPVLQSTASAAFPRYTSVPKQSPLPQMTHVKFGDQPSMYTSSAQNSYQNLPGDRTEFLSDELQDLRKSHFTLGFYLEKRKPELEKTAALKSEAANVQLQKTNIKLGNVKEKWISSYETDHRKEVLKIDKTCVQSTVEGATQSHFILGQHPSRLRSTSQDYYKPSDHPIQVTSLPPERENDLRTQHFSIGENTKRDWKRVSENYGQEVSSVESAPKLLPNRDIWTHHFRYGSYESDYKRSSKLQLPQVWERAALDEETRKRLTCTSTQLGYDQTLTLDSTYKDSYLWIQPAADTRYKMSIQEYDRSRI